MGKKKIIFIGPPGAGKTSLKKVFFEGESSKKILKQTLAPTLGEESIVLNFQEKIGIFDLAGQENETWLQNNDNSILIDSSIIIVVVDCKESFENNLEFIKKVINIRDQIVAEGLIYVLVHKIDLISESELHDLKELLQDRLYYYNYISLAFTSIKREYFPYTFSLFIEILRICIQRKIVSEKSEIEYVYNSVFFLFLINQGNMISKEELQHKLRISELDFNKTESLLFSRQFIKTNTIGPTKIYRLTEKGASYLTMLLCNFSLENLRLFENISYEKSIKPLDENIKFIGFFIADKNGLPVIKVEFEEGYFNYYLNSEKKVNPIDIDLVTSLISALEMFSSEINIKDFAGFKLKGSNITVQSFNHRVATISFLANSSANIQAVESYINEWVNSFLNKYERKIEISIRCGERTMLQEMEDEGKKWLHELNNRYNELVNNQDIYDQSEVQSLYSILDKLSPDSISKEELRIVGKLKSELIKTSIEKDISSLKDLSKIIRDL